MKKYIPIVLVSCIALIVWLPLLMLISGSFMPIDEIKTYFGPVLLGGSGFAKWPLIPAYPTMAPYIELLLDSPAFFAMFWNSIKIVVPILIGQVCFGMPAAWAFARFEFLCKKLLFTLYIALMLMPFQVTMVPNYLVLDKMNLLNTRGALIYPLVFSTFPVFIMYRFFKSIPEAMIEATKMDGAGHFRTFIHIGLPLGAAGIVSALVLGFLEYWNMIEQPLTFIQDKSLWPLSLYLPQIAVDQLSVSIVASVIMLIPALLVFLWGQNDLEAGIRAAGLKE